MTIVYINDITNYRGEMAMVIVDFIECPQCGGLIYKYEDVPSYGEVHQCYSCGYFYDSEIMKLEDVKGYGVACFTGKDGNMEHYPLESDDFDLFYSEFLKIINSRKDLSKYKCYITKWNESKRQVEVMHGRLPDSYKYYTKSKHYSYLLNLKAV